MHIGCYTTYVLRIAFTHINLILLGMNSYILEFHTSKRFYSIDDRFDVIYGADYLIKNN